MAGIDSFTIYPVADGEDVWGSHARVRLVDITLGATYPTGGYTITPDMFGLTALFTLEPYGGDGTSFLYVPLFAYTTLPLGLSGGRLHILSSITGAEVVAGAGTVASYKFRLRVTGE
jgi:hypothetical protein